MAHRLHSIKYSTVAGSISLHGGFHTKSCASCSAVEHGGCFYMRTCLRAWMFTQTVPLVHVSLSLLHDRRPDQKVPQIRRVTRGHFGNASFKRGIYQ